MCACMLVNKMERHHIDVIINIFRYARAIRRRLKNVKPAERECALSAQQSGGHLQVSNVHYIVC